MNLQELKEIINNEIKPCIIDQGKTPYQFEYNKILFIKLNNKYNNFFVSISELIYLCRNINNLENLHIFCNCGNKNTFKGINKQYSFYCCVKCSNSNELKKNKIKQTNLKHWGVTCNWSSKNPKLNGRYTKLIKYGNENYNNINKIKQTSLQKDENGLNSYQRAYNTALNNIDKNGLNSIERAKIKEYQTKKKNHTFNTSKYEEQIYNYLLKKFNKDDVIRQYRSKQYQFNCDFYIKSLDLYIEYHGTWTHHNKPFKNSIEDLEEVEKLKNKSLELNFKGQRKLQYLNTINIWTKVDPLKLRTFKQNKLNYKIFYRIEQFLNWYNKI